MSFKHIFFDLDNTLWDHRKNAYLTIQALYEETQIEKKHRVNFDNFHAKYYEINEELWALIRDGKISKEELRERRFYTTFLHFGIDDKELADYFDHRFINELGKHNYLVEGAREVLDYLHAKDYHLHVISNGFGEITHEKIINSKLAHYFESITSADDAGVRKPNPKIFQVALAEGTARKEESVLVGDDWIADIYGAKNFGMEAIFFDSLKEGWSEPGLKVITELSQLKQWL